MAAEVSRKNKISLEVEDVGAADSAGNEKS